MWIWKIAIATLFVVNSALAAPSIVSPAPGTQLPPGEVRFSWDPDGIAIQQWEVTAGSSPGGSEYFSSGSISNDDVTTVNITPWTTIKGLPQDESSVYFTLRLRDSGVIQTLEAEYTAAERVPVIKDVDIPFIYGPVIFSWDPNGLDLVDTRVRILYRGPFITGQGPLTPRLGSATNSGVISLPASGDLITVRLWYRLSSSGAVATGGP